MSGLVLPILTIIALLLGPFIGAQVSAWLQKRSSETERRKTIFKTLMATRANRISHEHVQALNLIDLEFYEEKPVTAAWAKYLEYLGKDVNKNDEKAWNNWNNISNDLFVDLLQKMAKVLKYDYDVDHIKRSVYSPQAHGELIKDQFRYRKAVLELIEGLLSGKIALPVQNVFTEKNLLQQEELAENLINVLKGKQGLLFQAKLEERSDAPSTAE